jgi:hypothetical protein
MRGKKARIEAARDQSYLVVAERKEKKERKKGIKRKRKEEW